MQWGNRFCRLGSAAEGNWQSLEAFHAGPAMDGGRAWQLEVQSDGRLEGHVMVPPGDKTMPSGLLEVEGSVDAQGRVTAVATGEHGKMELEGRLEPTVLSDGWRRLQLVWTERSSDGGAIEVGPFEIELESLDPVEPSGDFQVTAEIREAESSDGR